VDVLDTEVVQKLRIRSY